MDRKAELRSVLSAIRRLLLTVCDPIGVANEPAVRGEYDQDALALYGMMVNGASDAELEAYLVKSESEAGLGGGSRRSHREVVHRLRQLGITPSTSRPAV